MRFAWNSRTRLRRSRKAAQKRAYSRDGSYKPFVAYAQSKLAMLMFTFELQRQSDAEGWRLLCAAAHPGFAANALMSNGPRLGRAGRAGLIEKIISSLAPLVSQSASEGALATLFAATSPTACKASYYGPTGFMALKASGPSR